MNRPKQLSASFVRTVNEPGRYGDGRGGHGLSLLVKATKNGRLSKTWSQRLRVNGKPINIGLGSFPIISLAEARAKALENRRAVAQGRDPRRGAGVPTFEQAAEKVIGIHAAGWKDGGKTEKQWRASLRDYAMPRLGNKRVDEITTSDVLGALTPVWHTRPETARRVRRRVRKVLSWCQSHGYVEHNAAGEAIDGALPKNNGARTHHRALPHGEVAAALAKVRKSEAWPSAKLAFEFLVLTACRSSEVRLATWAEIDTDAREWRIPGSRMKGGREHRQPLSDAAMAVLEQAGPLRAQSDLLFPSPSRPGRPLSDRALSSLCRENDIGCVPHGFRSSFRDWASECTDTSHAVMELCLAHHVGDATVRAYARSDLVLQRRAVMEVWSEYLRLA